MPFLTHLVNLVVGFEAIGLRACRAQSGCKTLLQSCVQQAVAQRYAWGISLFKHVPQGNARVGFVGSAGSHVRCSAVPPWCWRSFPALGGAIPLALNPLGFHHLFVSEQIGGYRVFVFWRAFRFKASRWPNA